jgi:hypothetical protein
MARKQRGEIVETTTEARPADPRLVSAFAVGGQPLPCRPHSCRRLVRVLSHLMEPAGQYRDYRI